MARTGSSPRTPFAGKRQPRLDHCGRTPDVQCRMRYTPRPHLTLTIYGHSIETTRFQLRSLICKCGNRRLDPATRHRARQRRQPNASGRWHFHPSARQTTDPPARAYLHPRLLDPTIITGSRAHRGELMGSHGANNLTAATTAITDPPASLRNDRRTSHPHPGRRKVTERISKP